MKTEELKESIKLLIAVLDQSDSQGFINLDLGNKIENYLAKMGYSYFDRYIKGVTK